MSEALIKESERTIEEIYSRCLAAQPNFGLERAAFSQSLNKTLSRFVQSSVEVPPKGEEIRVFLDQIQHEDLFLALACANGSERVWWEFDQQHRSYMERVARRLAKTETDAQEVVDSVYVELYGTRVVDGERVSKFASYSGRGTLRGWLRTVIWHSLVDLHRATQEEVSLDEIIETVGEGTAHASFAEMPAGDEMEMVDHIARSRYRTATFSSIESAFSSLEPHEKLLLLYYHVDELKLREIAKLVENEASPLRGWFQRKSQTRENNPSRRIHESTVMRWLDRCYGKALSLFREELTASHGLSSEEIDICMELATEDLAGGSVFRKLSAT
ncbi:MAG: hypothetical protein ABR535_06360 [Pyrinomonadaceae bacterium]